MVGLSEALALYLRPKGIGVSCLCPGPVATNIVEQITFHDDVPINSPLDLEVIDAEKVGDIVVDAVRTPFSWCSPIRSRCTTSWCGERKTPRRSSPRRSPPCRWIGDVKVGIHLPQYGRAASADVIRRAGVHAEELGFAYVWVSHHVALPASQDYPSIYVGPPPPPPPPPPPERPGPAPPLPKQRNATVGKRTRAAATSTGLCWIAIGKPEYCRIAEFHPRVHAYVKNHNLGLEVPYRYGSEMRKYMPDFIVLVDDGHGDDDLLHLIVEIKGYRREDAKKRSPRWTSTGFRV